VVGRLGGWMHWPDRVGWSGWPGAVGLEWLVLDRVGRGSWTSLSLSRERGRYTHFFFHTLHHSVSSKTTKFQGGLSFSQIPHRIHCICS